jgi:hypothetical protein
MREIIVNNRGVLLISMAAAIIVFILNRNATSESHIFTSEHVQYARALSGELDKPLLPFPIWGYPLAIVVFGAGVWLKLFQFFLALLVFVWIYRTWFQSSATSITGKVLLVLFAWIWFSTASVYWPAAIAVPLWWISLILFRRAMMTQNSIKAFILPGVSAGIAANFRSDLLFLTLFVFVIITALGTAKSERPALIKNVRNLAISLVAILVMLVPWGIYNMANDHGFRLTSSNGGSVAVITLGQLPGNVWGISHNDLYLATILEELDVQDQSPYHPDTDRQLWGYFFDQVSDHPVEYIKKFAWNIKNSLLGGLYVGDIQTFSGESNAEAIDDWRESLKSLVGLNVNRNTNNSDANKNSLGLLSIPFALFVIGVGLTAVSAVVVIAALVSLIAGARIHGLEIPERVALSSIVGVMLMVAAFQYQPRHMNVAAPAFFILALPAADYLVTRIRASKFFK